MYKPESLSHTSTCEKFPHHFPLLIANLSIESIDIINISITLCHGGSAACPRCRLSPLVLCVSRSVVSHSLRPHGSLSITSSWSLLKLMSIKSVMPSKLSPSPPTFNLSQRQGLFQRVNSSHQVTKVLEFQLQHQSLQ